MEDSVGVAVEAAVPTLEPVPVLVPAALSDRAAGELVGDAVEVAVRNILETVAVAVALYERGPNKALMVTGKAFAYTLSPN